MTCQSILVERSGRLSFHSNLCCFYFSSCVQAEPVFYVNEFDFVESSLTYDVRSLQVRFQVFYGLPTPRSSESPPSSALRPRDCPHSLLSLTSRAASTLGATLSLCHPSHKSLLIWLTSLFFRNTFRTLSITPFQIYDVCGSVCVTCVVCVCCVSCCVCSACCTSSYVC